MVLLLVCWSGVVFLPGAEYWVKAVVSWVDGSGMRVSERELEVLQDISKRLVHSA